MIFVKTPQYGPTLFDNHERFLLGSSEYIVLMERTVWHHPKFARAETEILKEHLHSRPTAECSCSLHTTKSNFN